MHPSIYPPLPTRYYESRGMVNPSIKGTIPNKLSKEEIEQQRDKQAKWEMAHLGGFEKIYPSEVKPTFICPASIPLDTFAQLKLSLSTFLFILNKLKMSNSPHKTQDPELQQLYLQFLETAQNQWDEWSGA